MVAHRQRRTMGLLIDFLDGDGQPFALKRDPRHELLGCRGARAYLLDRPAAELHLLDTGHFALEDRLETITPLIVNFLDNDPGADRQ